MSDRPAIAVLGLGNELFTDEGVGVRAAHVIAEMGLAGVEALDGGTLGLALLPAIEGRRGLLVLDAIVSFAGSPGDIVELGPEELAQPRRLLLSAHQVGVSETVGAASLLGTAPELMGAVGLVPFSLDTGYGLSAGAAARLPALVERAVAVLRRWGVQVPAHA